MSANPSDIELAIQNGDGLNETKYSGEVKTFCQIPALLIAMSNYYHLLSFIRDLHTPSQN